MMPRTKPPETPDCIHVDLPGYGLEVVATLSQEQADLLSGLDVSATGADRILRILNKDERLLGEWTFCYGYPFEESRVTKHEISKKHGMVTLGDFLLPAATDYEDTYDSDPDAFDDLGHDLGDLVFEGLDLDVRNRVANFSVGS